MRLRDMRKALVACALVLCPLAARAQTTSTFSLTSPQATTTTITTTTSTPQIFVGAAACGNDPLTFNWDLTTLGGLQAGQVVNILKVHNSGECSGTSVTGAFTGVVHLEDVDDLARLESAEGGEVPVEGERVVTAGSRAHEDLRCARRGGCRGGCGLGTREGKGRSRLRARRERAEHQSAGYKGFPHVAESHSKEGATCPAADSRSGHWLTSAGC